MICKFFRIVLFLYFTVSFGQSTKLDSLQQALQLVTNDSLRVKILKDISWEYLNNRSNIPLAKKYIDSFSRLSSQSHNEIDLMFWFKLIVYFEWFNHTTLHSVRYFGN